MRKLTLAVALTLVVVWGNSLPSQTPQPASTTAGRLVLTTNSAEAKAEFWKGMEEWQTATYTSAARHFARAYALDNNFALAHLLSMGEVQARELRGGGECERPGIPLLGKLLQRRTSRVAEPKEPRPLVESLACRVVERLAEHGTVDDAKKALDSARVWRSRFPDYTPVALPIAFLNLAATDTAAALRAAEEYTRIATSPAVAFGAYGGLLWNLSRYDETETQFRKGIAVPGHPDYGWNPAGALAEL